MNANSWQSALRIASGAVAAAAGSALILIGPAGSALAPASSTVTIQAEGTDIFGTVKSPRAACKGNREVIVYKQIGGRGGGNDRRFASDTSEDNGDWSIGNPGTEGKFYAKVKKNARCKADFSPTIRVSR